MHIPNKPFLKYLIRSAEENVPYDIAKKRYP